MCVSLSQRSTCIRIQTATIIVHNNVIVSIGYNGVVSGKQHCNEKWKHHPLLNTDDFRSLHHNWSTLNEIHAEMNAIVFAGKNGVSTSGTTLYTLYSPCIQCAKLIVASGISRVVFGVEYDRSTEGLKFLAENGIRCEHVPVS